MNENLARAQQFLACLDLDDQVRAVSIMFGYLAESVGPSLMHGAIRCAGRQLLKTEPDFALVADYVQPTTTQE